MMFLCIMILIILVVVVIVPDVVHSRDPIAIAISHSYSKKWIVVEASLLQYHHGCFIINSNKSKRRTMRIRSCNRSNNNNNNSNSFLHSFRYPNNNNKMERWGNSMDQVHIVYYHHHHRQRRRRPTTTRTTLFLDLNNHNDDNNNNNNKINDNNTLIVVPIVVLMIIVTYINVILNHTLLIPILPITTLILFLVLRTLVQQYLIMDVELPNETPDISTTTTTTTLERNNNLITNNDNNNSNNNNSNNNNDITAARIPSIQMDITILLFSFVIAFLLLPTEPQIPLSSSSSVIDNNDSNINDSSYFITIIYAGIPIVVGSMILLWINNTIIRPMIQNDEDITENVQTSFISSYRWKEIPTLKEWDNQFQSFLVNNNNNNNNEVTSKRNHPDDPNKPISKYEPTSNNDYTEHGE